MGQGRISTTTRAMEDAGHRVSRYLSMQFLSTRLTGSCCYGVAFYWVRMPRSGDYYPGCCDLFRTWAHGRGRSAGVAVIRDFHESVHTAHHHRFICRTGSDRIEFVEPWVYGANTGVSPFALIISAVFWTWLWGPVGLLFVYPLTVCLAVMGDTFRASSFLHFTERGSSTGA